MTPMDSYKRFGFMEILSESAKLLPKNRNLVTFTVTLSLLLNSILFFFSTFYIQPLLNDLVLKGTRIPSTSPTGSDFSELLDGIKKDVTSLLGVSLALLPACVLVSLFTTTATIITTAISYSGKIISVKDLITRAVRSWLRTFVTTTLITLIFMAYAFLFAFVIVILQFTIFDSPASSKTTITVLGIFALIMYAHLYVVWELAIVISVLEDRFYGAAALRKSREIVKGKRLEGFVLVIACNLLSEVISQVFSRIVAGGSSSSQVLMGLFIMYSSRLIGMFQSVAYTVLYFKCKKNHGEVIELQGSGEYSKIASLPILPEEREEFSI